VALGESQRLLAALRRTGWEVVREEGGSRKTLRPPTVSAAEMRAWCQFAGGAQATLFHVAARVRSDGVYREQVERDLPN
jgi:hypothetical protein